ncbi:hypothetical protein CR513_53666, partial [Mucuna pruriens]
MVTKGTLSREGGCFTHKDPLHGSAYVGLFGRVSSIWSSVQANVTGRTVAEASTWPSEAIESRSNIVIREMITLHASMHN